MVLDTLGWFGSMIGIIIGCSAISSELAGNALSSLAVKPVYRTTIINGKVLGALGFMAVILMIFAAVFTAGFIILCGNVMEPFLPEYFARLPFVLIYAMINVAVFLSISILISLIVRDQAFAMIISVLTVYISEIMTYPDIGSNLNNIFPGSGLDSLITGLSPRVIEMKMQPVFLDPSWAAFDAFVNILPDLSKLLVFAVIALVLSYVVFMRRDIS
jgi:ABC-2 type transport system permease protein